MPRRLNKSNQETQLKQTDTKQNKENDIDKFLYGCKLFVGKENGYVLVIVESPGKIKKLESILGNGYVVTSSFGHIIDLHPNKLSIDMDNNFEPSYFVLAGKEKYKDKTKVVNDLRLKAAKAKEVILASDKDREGEFIAWSYMIALNLKDPKRITFNSITKKDIHAAIETPGKINMLMVDSQKTRRIEDRIVGFKISPELSKLMGTWNLSAGRVQSIVVRLICDKEDEINQFMKTDKGSYFKCTGQFKYTESDILKSVLCSSAITDDNNDNASDSADDDEPTKNVKIKTFQQAHNLIISISKSTFKITNITTKKSKRYPSAPYTTSTVQQDCSTKLGLSVKQTMQALQKLYEAGYTTYLRTDSTALSEDAMQQCQSYVTSNFGEKYYNKKTYTNKKGNTQEAHEAIRPVDIRKKQIEKNDKVGQTEQRVYNLVWKRTVGSQMMPADIDVHAVHIGISKEPKYYFEATFEQITFLGYLILYEDQTTEQIKLPKKNQTVDPIEVKCNQEYCKPPLRYTEAGLVKKMDPKNLNIGRPATYAEIINTVQKRGYVEIKDIEGITKDTKTISWLSDPNEIKVEDKHVSFGKENKKFVPTSLGREVTNIMMKYFPDIMEYAFTSHMELQLDEIAEGTVSWTAVLTEFWNKLQPLLERIQKEKKIDHVIGTHPESGAPISVSVGPYGPYLTMVRDKSKVVAPIKPPLTQDTITLEQALELLLYPKLIGVHEKSKVELKKGQYGFYLTWKKQSTSVPGDISPDELSLEKAMELFEKKQQENQEKKQQYLYYAKEGDIEYTVHTGKYEDNRYLMIRNTKKKKEKPTFINFPIDKKLDDITLEQIKELATTQRKKRYSKKKACR